jgi:cytoskeleton protein RodZ
MEPVGSRLARQRERRDITLQEIARITKINIHYLNAIDHDQLNRLPGGIITKGFLRAYAKEVGVDSDEIIADYTAAVQASQRENVPSPQPEAKPLRTKSEWVTEHITSWGSAAALLLGFFILLWAYNRQLQPPSGIAETPSKATEHSDVAVPDSVPQSNASASRKTTSSAARSAEPGSAPGLTTLPSNVSNDAPNELLAPRGFSVSIRVRRDAWISVNADGKQMVYRTLIAPSETTVAARQRILIRVGNAGGVDFLFNGRQIPVQGEYDEAKTLVFDANGIQNSSVIPATVVTREP